MNIVFYVCLSPNNFRTLCFIHIFVTTIKAGKQQVIHQYQLNYRKEIILFNECKYTGLTEIIQELESMI